MEALTHEGTAVLEKKVAHVAISSPAFLENEMIPAKYTCEGANINPPLEIGNLPKRTKSMVLMVEDPDAPINVWTHWVVWNMPVLREIKEDSVPGILALNSFHQCQYSGPCPPSGTHRYIFKLYALDTYLQIAPGCSKRVLEKVMACHIMGYGELVGLYRKQGKN